MAIDETRQLRSAAPDDSLGKLVGIERKAARLLEHAGGSAFAARGMEWQSQRSKQPTSACGAPLWVKMVAARAGLSESLHGRSC